MGACVADGGRSCAAGYAACALVGGVVQVEQVSCVGWFGGNQLMKCDMCVLGIARQMHGQPQVSEYLWSMRWAMGTACSGASMEALAGLDVSEQHC